MLKGKKKWITETSLLLQTPQSTVTYCVCQGR